MTSVAVGGARTLAAAVLLALAASTAAAQSGNAAAPALRPWRPVLVVGAAWSGAQDLGRVTAGTRRALTGTATPPSFALFTTESTLEAAVAGEFGVTLPLTERWAIGVRGGVARPTLSTAITGDAEGAPATTATEDVSDYTVEGSLSYQLPRFGGRRARPYLTAGGGYVRQLHEDHVLVETGSSWHGGAGLRVWLRGGGPRARAVGLTGEVRWVWRTGGITFADGTRSMPAAAAGVFVGF